MNEYVIMSDSCCDLPYELAQRISLITVPLGATIDGDTYEANLDGKALTLERFYELLAVSSSASTSAVSSGLFAEYMERELSAGKDILYLAFSSGLSATYDNAGIAAGELRAKYPERKIYIVDTMCASMGEGLLVYLAAQEKEKGASIEELRDFAEGIKHNICHWFFVDELGYLKRGGRISKSTAFVGSLLNIKPILLVDESGHLAPHSKARGVKNVIKSMVEHMGETIRDAAGQTVMISHADAFDRAKDLAETIKQKFPNIKDIIINHIGPTIGCHTGPGCIALFFKGVMPTG
ncbi:MAG: DegV family protein [Oscillospiraceae bacterium]|jgi:DegV family protein with EDD domain|nr:DegV family protein [Oscillospiraceae bacterium]